MRWAAEGLKVGMRCPSKLCTGAAFFSTADCESSICAFLSTAEGERPEASEASGAPPGTSTAPRGAPRWAFALSQLTSTARLFRKRPSSSSSAGAESTEGRSAAEAAEARGAARAEPVAPHAIDCGVAPTGAPADRTQPVHWLLVCCL